MERTVFGKVMMSYRQRYNLQQKSICRGICSTTTYLRAEIEERIVDFVVQETLLARVGQSATNFEIMLSDEEFELWEERLAIRAAMAAKQMDVLQNKLNAYHSENAHKHKLHQQFCQYYELKLAQYRKEDAAKICCLATATLSITKEPDGCPDSMKNLYTPMELDLLLILVQHRHGSWKEPENRAKCLSSILEYLKNIPIMESREEIEGIVWMELLSLNEIISYEKLLEYVDCAIENLRQGSSLLRLAEVYFIKAKYLRRHLQHVGDSEKTALLEQCQNACVIAYNIFEVMECTEKLAEVETFCKEELQWHITIQMKSFG